MAEEPEIPLSTEEPRICPACGSRVAALATTCLMCGASLVEEEAPPERRARRELPGIVRAIIVVALALAILSAGSFGLYKLLNAEPEPVDVNVTPSSTPTVTPTPTSTPTPTQTPTPTSTSTPIPPLVHQVQPGEVLLSIADDYDVTIDQILALNPDVEPELLQVGQLLLIPVPTPTPGPTATFEPGVPTPTPPDYIIHIVAQGETLSTIAEKYDVSLALIREVNDLSPDDDTIFPNQSLVIPMGTPVPSPTPTVDPNATPTPIPPYPPPPLLSPPDGATLVSDGGPVLLQWASVSVLHDDEWYELTLSQPSGGLLAHKVHTRATAWRVPLDLLRTPNAEMRKFHWQVQVVREMQNRNGELVYREAGPPSEVRTFIWLEPTPTPSPSPTPATE